MFLYRKIEGILDLVGSVSGVGKWFVDIGWGWRARVAWVCLCMKMKGEYTMKKAFIIANMLFASATVWGMNGNVNEDWRSVRQDRIIQLYEQPKVSESSTVDNDSTTQKVVEFKMDDIKKWVKEIGNRTLSGKIKVEDYIRNNKNVDDIIVESRFQKDTVLSDIKKARKINLDAVLNLVIQHDHYKKSKTGMPSSLFIQYYNGFYQELKISSFTLARAYNFGMTDVVHSLINQSNDTKMLTEFLSYFSQDFAIGHSEVKSTINLLIERGADINGVPDIVKKCFYQEEPEMVRYFLDNGFDRVKAKEFLDNHKKYFIRGGESNHIEEWKEIAEELGVDLKNLDSVENIVKHAPNEKMNGFNQYLIQVSDIDSRTHENRLMLDALTSHAKEKDEVIMNRLIQDQRRKISELLTRDLKK